MNRPPYFNWRMVAASSAVGGVIGALSPAFHATERTARWLAHETQILLVAWIVVATLATLAAFVVDKFLARLGRRRISENRLHWMVALGGVGGAILGMLLVRHKTIDPVFRLRLLVVVVPQLAAAAGAAWLAHRSCCGA